MTCGQLCRRKSIIAIIGIAFMLYGITLGLLAYKHFQYDINVCKNTNIPNHSELRLWDDCEYKVYPFTWFGDSNPIPCQCRTLRITDESLRNNNISSVIHSFEHFYMLQNLQIITTSTNDYDVINLTSNMFNAMELVVLDIHYLKLNYIDQNIKKLRKLQYLSLLGVSPLYINAPIIPQEISQLTNLRYLNLQQNILVNIDFICNLTNLESLILNGNSNLNFPDCMYSNLKNLKHFDIQVTTAVNTNFDYRLLRLPNLKEFNANRNAYIGSSIFPTNITDFAYNENTVYYLQKTTLCLVFQYLPDSLPLYLRKFLNDTNACVEHCNYAVNEGWEEIVCIPTDFQNGICDDGCNLAECNYDGGDCIQTCDFNICDIHSLGNGVCDTGCNTTECNYDNGDCMDISVTVNVNDTCTNTGCELDWLNDGWCDQYCNNEYCNFDETSCNKCDSKCEFFTQSFFFAANSIVKDNLIEEQELCQLWYILETSTAYGSFQYNCSTIIPIIDVDGNGKLNAFEGSLAILAPRFGEKRKQLNCSLCASDVLSYYTPWNYDEMMYYFNIIQNTNIDENLSSNWISES